MRTLVLTLLLLLCGATAAQAGPTGQFNVACEFSHRLKDDPIVFPGQEGASHSHDFFGNRSTDADSTAASIRAADSNCGREGDRAAYWLPTLYRNGAPVPAVHVLAYYRSGLRELDSIERYPAGLRVIAGDSKATENQPRAIANWRCGGASPATATQLPPEDCDQTKIVLTMKFPDCWDGRRLDSADHKSHMAYSSRPAGAALLSCPFTHPVPVPQLSIIAKYNVTGEGVTLASGHPRTAHADFFDGWNQAALDDLLCGCIQPGIDCGYKDPEAEEL